MSMSASERKIAPTGYFDLRLAIESIWRRMFTSGIPPEILAAAEVNLAATPEDILEDRDLSRCSQLNKPFLFSEPTNLIVGALHRGALTLFIYVESRQRVIPIPANYAQEVLEKAGF